MPTAPNTIQAEHEALVQAIVAVLTPLAQLCTAKGVPIQEVESRLRGAFVQAARQAHPNTGSKPNISWISAATGLTRREVSRHLEQTPSPAAARLSPASQLFTRWLTSPIWHDAPLRPMPLPRQGRHPSFEALALSVTRDVHPRTLLEELGRLNLVRLDKQTDTVYLEAGSFVPRGDWSRMLAFLGHNVGDHLRAAIANVLGDGKQHFEQAIFADELSAQSMETVRQLVSQQWAHLLDVLVPRIEALIEQDREAGRPMDQQIRIGFFTWADSMPIPPPTQKGEPHESP